jgi:hypothetical protein
MIFRRGWGERTCSTPGNARSVYNISVGKPQGKRPLGRLRRTWENNTEITEVEREGLKWIEMAQDRIQWWTTENTIINLRGPIKARDFLKMPVIWNDEPGRNCPTFQRSLLASIIRRVTVSSSETLANFYQTTRRNIPEDSHLHTRPLENLKSHLGNFLTRWTSIN